MKATQNGSLLARWVEATVGGYRVAWIEGKDGRTAPFCIVDLPSTGRKVHIDARGPMLLDGLHVSDIYAAADAYVAIVSACMGWGRP